VKIYVAAEEALRKNDRQDETQNLPPKLVEKLVWVSVISLCKISIPSYRFDETQSLPPKLVEKLVWVPVISLCKIFIPSYRFDALLC